MYIGIDGGGGALPIEEEVFAFDRIFLTLSSSEVEESD
jgi:hypothetical protein